MIAWRVGKVRHDLEHVEDPPEGWDAPASPVGRILLLNPAHPDWTRVEVGSPFDVPWDERLLR